MIYAYIRVSTDRQNVENQKFEINTFCRANKLKINKYIEEVISSRKNLHQRRLGGLLRNLKSGDILIASEISRLGRNMLEVMGILQTCLEKNCQIWTLKENYRLGLDIQSKVLAFAFSLSAEIERQLISQRTRESLKKLRDEGRHLGRPYGTNYRKLDINHDEIIELWDCNLSKTEIARIYGCSWITVHRYIERYYI